MLYLLATIEDGYNENKLEALYYKYRMDMFRVAYRILNDYHLAQDAVQSAFITLINNLDNIDEIDCKKTRAFVIIITRNISINLYRKRKKHNNMVLEEIETILADESQFVDEKIIEDELFDRIASKIKELYPPYADILSLKYFYHYSDKKIAKLLGITYENARTRLHRAKKSLIKAIMEDEEWEEDEFFFKRKRKSKKKDI